MNAHHQNEAAFAILLSAAFRRSEKCAEGIYAVAKQGKPHHASRECHALDEGMSIKGPRPGSEISPFTLCAIYTSTRERPPHIPCSSDALHPLHDGFT